MGKPERLHKLLAHAGFGSRRRCEELIRAGRVTVDGEVVDQLGAKADPDKQELRCDGNPVRPEKRVYFLLCKPKGLICSNSRKDGRTRVVDLFSHIKQRLYTIGRLDVESEGLIIITNDGELCQRVSHPRYRVPRTYRVVVRGSLSAEGTDKIRRGLWLAEGKTAAARLRIHRRSRGSTVLDLTLTEGKNREVRRIFARVGHPVSRLVRTRIGNLRIGRLRPGQWLALSRETLLSKAFRPLKQDASPKPRRKKATSHGRKRSRKSLSSSAFRPSKPRGRPKPSRMKPTSRSRKRKR